MSMKALNTLGYAALLTLAAGCQTPHDAQDGSGSFESVIICKYLDDSRSIREVTGYSQQRVDVFSITYGPASYVRLVDQNGVPIAEISTNDIIDIRKVRRETRSEE